MNPHFGHFLIYFLPGVRMQSPMGTPFGVRHYLLPCWSYSKGGMHILMYVIQLSKETSLTQQTKELR